MGDLRSEKMYVILVAMSLIMHSLSMLEGCMSALPACTSLSKILVLVHHVPPLLAVCSTEFLCFDIHIYERCFQDSLTWDMHVPTLFP